MPTRRTFLSTVSAGMAAAALPRRISARAAQAGVKFRLGVTDWNLRLEGDVKSVALAKACGFDGVQISLGKRKGAPPPGHPAVLDQFAVLRSKRVGVPIASVCLDILHRQLPEVRSARAAVGGGLNPDGAAHGRQGHAAAVFRPGRAEDTGGDGLRRRCAARARRRRRRKPASSSAWKTRSRPATTCASWSARSRRRC